MKVKLLKGKSKKIRKTFFQSSDFEKEEISFESGKDLFASVPLKKYVDGLFAAEKYVGSCPYDDCVSGFSDSFALRAPNEKGFFLSEVTLNFYVSQFEILMEVEIKSEKQQNYCIDEFGNFEKLKGGFLV